MEILRSYIKGKRFFVENTKDLVFSFDQRSVLCYNKKGDIMKQKISFWLVILGIFCLDQGSKLILTRILSLKESIVVFPKFFSLTYVENKGGAFSILNGHIFFLIFIAFVALFLLYYFWKKEAKKDGFNFFGYTFLIGGTLGNLCDRLIHNYVIDFFHFQIGDYHFPIFNIGDIAIVLGVFFLFVAMVRGEIHARN